MQSISEERELVGSSELEFHCRCCDATSILDALRFKTINKYLGLIKVWVTYETAVKCPECGATFRSSTELNVLEVMSVEEASRDFRLRIGLVEKFLVIADQSKVGKQALGVLVSSSSGADGTKSVQLLSDIISSL